MFELHSFMLLERYDVVMVLPFSNTLGQFAMVFVSIIHDVQFCTVSIHMQGVPLAFVSGSLAQHVCKQALRMV